MKTFNPVFMVVLITSSHWEPNWKQPRFSAVGENCPTLDFSITYPIAPILTYLGSVSGTHEDLENSSPRFHLGFQLWCIINWVINPKPAPPHPAPKLSRRIQDNVTRTPSSSYQCWVVLSFSKGKIGAEDHLQQWSVCDLHSKIRWKKVKTCQFSSGNGFGSLDLNSSRWLVKCAASLCTCRNECNKYDLTAAQCFWKSSVQVVWFGVSQLFAVPVSVLWVGLEKCKQLNLDVTIFLQGDTREDCVYGTLNDSSTKDQRTNFDPKP